MIMYTNSCILRLYDSFQVTNYQGYQGKAAVYIKRVELKNAVWPELLLGLASMCPLRVFTHLLIDIELDMYRGSLSPER